MNTFCFVTSLAPRLPHTVRSFRPAAICMGRRSEKIKTRKDKQTQMRTKVFARIGKMITIAAKAGGPDVEVNRALADALDAARAANVPKETTNNAIKRATDPNIADFKQSSFEIYGKGGVAIYVDVLTDNPNRSAADIRALANRNEMKLAQPGSVAYNFDRMGVLRIENTENINEDALFEAAIEAGAEECETDPQDEGYFKIVTALNDMTGARKSLTDAGYVIDSFTIEMVPKSCVETSDADRIFNKTTMEKLMELDDVDGVYSNMLN